LRIWGGGNNSDSLLNIDNTEDSFLSSVTPVVEASSHLRPHMPRIDDGPGGIPLYAKNSENVDISSAKNEAAEVITNNVVACGEERNNPNAVLLGYISSSICRRGGGGGGGGNTNPNQNPNQNQNSSAKINTTDVTWTVRVQKTNTPPTARFQIFDSDGQIVNFPRFFNANEAIVGEAVTFDGTLSFDGAQGVSDEDALTDMTFDWSLPGSSETIDNTNSQGTRASTTLSNTGTYDVRLDVTDTNGATSTKVKPVTIQKPSISLNPKEQRIWTVADANRPSTEAVFSLQSNADISADQYSFSVVPPSDLSESDLNISNTDSTTTVSVKDAVSLNPGKYTVNIRAEASVGSTTATTQATVNVRAQTYESG
jgi:hypothetical protein